MGGRGKEYWNERGMVSFEYKGESFYTVTPIPFYYKRRKLLLEELEPIVADPKVETICDFGCGDGWYMQYLSKKCEHKEWIGVDLSESMIIRAKDNFPNARFYVSEDGAPNDIKVDLVYAIAVFAHVAEGKKIYELISKISRNLNAGGRFVIFEQVSSSPARGETWCRRRPGEYIDIAKECGFKLEKTAFISFPPHRFFEKKIAPYYYRYFAKGSDSHARLINANRAGLFRCMSAAFLALTFSPVQYGGHYRGDGNCFFVFKKEQVPASPMCGSVRQ